MTTDEKLTPEEIDAIDLQDAMDAFIGAMKAIREAHEYLVLAQNARAYYVLGRAIKADEGSIKWSEVLE